MTTLCFVFGALLLSASAENHNQPQRTESVDSVVYKTTFHFRRGYGQWIETADYKLADELVSIVNENKNSKVDVKGWADRSGNLTMSGELAHKRARTIHNYLVQKGIDTSRIEYKGMGFDTSSDSDEARRADVVVVVPVERAAKPEPKPEHKPKPESKPAPAEKPQPKEEAKPVEVEEPAVVEEAAPAQSVVIAEPAAEPVVERFREPSSFSLRTNLVYWFGGLANVGAEWNPGGTNWGVLLNAGYSPFSSENWDQNLGGWFVSPEVHYYLGESKQWFIGAQYLTGGYDVKFWDFISETGYDGKVNAVGLLGGYRMTLSETFDMDFTLGVGYSTLKYDMYQYTEADGRTYISNGSVLKSATPIQMGVNLIWKIK